MPTGLYRVCLAVHQTGDELVFDMEGTSPQAPGFINCTFSGLQGRVVHWASAHSRAGHPLERGRAATGYDHAPKREYLCNASWPAPVSGATISTVWIVHERRGRRPVAHGELPCPAMAREGQAVTKGQMSVLTLAGRDRDGGPYRHVPAGLDGGRRRRICRPRRPERLGRL